MEIYISIDGVLRNLLQKFDYHYKDFYLTAETEVEEEFNYSINYPVFNDNLRNYYNFQSQEEFENFLFVEFPIEIYGHSGISYPNVITQVNKLIYENKEHNFTIVGLNELGKAKPSTLFFLSKNGFLGNNIKFIKSNDIESEWKKCDYWITDEKTIIDKCPSDKISVKFNTPYNQYFTTNKEISKLNEIEEPWLKSLEKSITSTLMELPKNVE